MRRIGAWFGVCLSGFWVGCVGSGFWVGFVGVVVRRCLAGFWVLQSAWLGLSWVGAAPAGLGPPPCCREAVLRPKAARLAFVVVVSVGFVCSWVWVGWVVLSFCGFAPDRKNNYIATICFYSFLMISLE